MQPMTGEADNEPLFSSLPYKIHRVYMPTLTVSISLMAASVAWAQAAPPAAAPDAPAGAIAAPPAPAPPPAAATAVDPAAFAALSAKVEEADQNARIAARKLELFEEQLATKARESPGTIADERGFGVRSADGANQLHFRLQLQADSRWFLADTNLSDRPGHLPAAAVPAGVRRHGLEHRGFSFHA